MLVRATLLAVGFAAGCKPDKPALDFETEHFRVYTDLDEPCRALGPWLEAHFDAITSHLGVQWPEGKKISVVRFGSRSKVGDACDGPSGAACSYGRTLYSTALFHPHELVHAYDEPLGTPPLVLQEGLAEVMGCGTWAPGQRIDKTAEIASWMRDRAFREGGAAATLGRYGAAAGFVRFLIDRFGRERFVELYAALDGKRGQDAVDEAFRSIFGVSLVETVEAWLEAPPQTRGGICIRPLECSTAPLDPEEVHRLELGCGVRSSPELLGYRGGIRTLSLEQDSELLLRISSEQDVSVGLSRCEGELPVNKLLSFPSSGEEAGLGGDVEWWTQLPAGRYWARIFALRPEAPIGERVRAQLAWEPREGSIATECGSSVPFTVGETTRRVRASFGALGAPEELGCDGDTCVRWISFAVGSDRELGIPIWADEDREPHLTELQLCEGGCPAGGGDCIEAAAEEAKARLEGYSLSAGRTYRLGMRAEWSQPARSVSLHFRPPR